MKKIEKYFKNLFISLSILGIILIPYYSFVPKTNAQNNPISSANTEVGLNGILGNLGPAIIQLPLCKKILKNGTKDLFSSISKSGTGKSTDVKDIGQNAKLMAIETSAQTENIGTYDPVNSAKLDYLLTNTGSTAKSTASTDANDTCLKSIGRMVTKMLLQKLTASTVEWINHGMDGFPTFMTNEDDFWGGVSHRTVLEFGTEISDQTLFPFGKDFMMAQAESMQKHFADNAQYSLNRILAPEGYTSIDFNQDFSNGGWKAWDAMTQIPANNPLGFQLMASQELNLRLQGTTISPAQALRDDINRSMGFISQKQCLDPYNLSQPDSDAALAKGEKDADGNVIGVCKKWRTVTPGSLIADAGMKVGHYSENQLLKAEDLNDAMAAVMDALLNNFTTKLFEKTGFAGDTKGADGQYAINQDFVNDSNALQVEKDFPETFMTNWLAMNPTFDIRKDVTQALIDDQRIYIQKLQDQNDQLYTNVTSSAQAVKLGLKPNYRSISSTANYGLIPLIYQLDYCIPGPHPGFEDDARTSLAQALGNGGIPVGPNKSWLLVEQTLDPGGAFSPASIDQYSYILTGHTVEQKKNRANNTAIIRAFAGFQPEADINVDSFEQVSTILEAVVERYIAVVRNVYSRKIMPEITSEAATEFKKAKGYQQLKENNSQEINDMKDVVVRLTNIKNGVEILNSKLASGTLIDPTTGAIATNQQQQYEKEIKSYISSYARVSAKMITGDDIAKVDNATKLIKDEEVYVYNELLRGDNGCEKQIQIWNPNRPNLPWGFVQYKRYPYPFPILYDYNGYDEGMGLPDVLYESPINNPRSIFTINTQTTQSFRNSKYQDKYGQWRYNGKTGLAGVTFGGVPNNGANDPDTGQTWAEYLDFCTQVGNINGQNVANCQNYEGPTFIPITDLVNIHVEANAEVLEKSLGMY